MGKLSKYKDEYNDLNVFRNPILLNELLDYAIQDSVALFNALSNAQELYIQYYVIDITDIVSTSSLSLKIFRSKYLDCNIPILKGSIDLFIRKSYFGGATDVYKKYAQNIKYYDVNSLYPDSMTKPMPYQIIKHHKNIFNINLDDFFGFCLVEVNCPIYLFN